MHGPPLRTGHPCKCNRFAQWCSSSFRPDPRRAGLFTILRGCEIDHLRSTVIGSARNNGGARVPELHTAGRAVTRLLQICQARRLVLFQTAVRTNFQGTCSSREHDVVYCVRSGLARRWLLVALQLQLHRGLDSAMFILRPLHAALVLSSARCCRARGSLDGTSPAGASLLALRDGLLIAAASCTRYASCLLSLRSSWPPAATRLDTPPVARCMLLALGGG
ncbi:hypothetical protein FB567DRAFT_614061 [Paraphoma chrysanthemicola]|uniref:Uncharacterized protein n=1 Tax=Paraphoma chrysanthemicola TaxID=798071 RepID=A0A8K0RDC3_9PLEO|nr:hypothetical protein FB567DRAFT_614061 [Paraphoma chrysanthemicola]